MMGCGCTTQTVSYIPSQKCAFRLKTFWLTTLIQSICLVQATRSSTVLLDIFERTLAQCCDHYPRCCCTVPTCPQSTVRRSIRHPSDNVTDRSIKSRTSISTMTTAVWHRCMQIAHSGTAASCACHPVRSSRPAIKGLRRENNTDKLVTCPSSRHTEHKQLLASFWTTAELDISPLVHASISTIRPSSRTFQTSLPRRWSTGQVQSPTRGS